MRCTGTCPGCGRRCTAAMAQSHRFDCCGRISAHVPTRHKGETRWAIISDPMRAGYLTGPSQTKEPSHG